ncbi:MAG TPA: choice-of-anchor D domain-containing protein, partial [Myxococcales bacterium]|nr:choice-of-anchor D domain-containing protein [Myxococcales bacterium]
QHPAVTVQLTGTPVASPVCKVNVVPAAAGGFGGFLGRVLQFGNVTVGHDKTLPITIQNVGSASCTIGGLKFTNGLGSVGGTICLGGTKCGDYQVTSTPASSIAPGQSTTIGITFSPRDTNQLPQLPSVYLNFHSGDPNVTSECQQNVPPDAAAGCMDVGMSGQGDVSNLAVLPSDLDFGLTTIGCNSPQENISLYNTGVSTPIHVTGITLDPVAAPFYISAPPTPFAVPPQGKVVITVKYKPSQASKETATLNVASDASNATSNNPYVTVALSGTGTTNKNQVDTFQQAARPTVDLLMIIDNSGSMQDYQSSLSQQGPSFITQALQANADFHIGVTSTENDKTDTPDSNASYRDPIHVGGLWGRPPLIDNGDANGASDFAANIKVGTCCSDDRESGLESAWHVLTPNADQTAPPQGSKGFLRDDARLVMLALSDENDQSHGSTAFYTDFFKQVKGQYNAGLVSFNAIVGDPGSGCNNGGITADSGDRYVDVVNATGGKWYSICSADWGQVARDLALGAFQGRVQFALSRTADPATVVVTLNGNPQSPNIDYTFDQPTNSVIFKTVPPSGSTIVVSYDALCF